MALQEEDLLKTNTNEEQPVPPAESAPKKAPLSGAIAIGTASSVFMMTLTTFLLTVRTVSALPMTVIATAAWETASQGHLPELSLGYVMGTAGQYLLASVTGLGIISATFSIPSGVALGIETMLGGSRIRNFLAGPDGDLYKGLARWKLVLIAGGIAAMDLGVGIAALRWWRGGEFNAVTRAWSRSLACGVIGGLITAPLLIQTTPKDGGIQLDETLPSSTNDVNDQTRQSS